MLAVLRGKSTNPAQPATSPIPVARGVFIELRGGDFRMPVGPGNWFSLPYFTAVWRKHWSRAWIPFVAWRYADFNLGAWKRVDTGGYIGAKIYGADSPSYTWLQPDEVGPGSQAIMLSFRPFAAVEAGQ